MRLHSMAAKNFKLSPDDFIYRYCGLMLARLHYANLNMLPEFPERTDRVRYDLKMAKSIYRNMSPAVGRVHDRLDGVNRSGVYDRLGSDRSGKPEFIVCDIDRD